MTVVVMGRRVFYSTSIETARRRCVVSSRRRVVASRRVFVADEFFNFFHPPYSLLEIYAG